MVTFNVNFDNWSGDNNDYHKEKLVAEIYKINNPITVVDVKGYIEDYIGDLLITLSNNYTIRWYYRITVSNTEPRFDLLIIHNNGKLVYRNDLSDNVIGSYPSLLSSLLHYVETLNLF